jgi:hypothetical protein
MKTKEYTVKWEMQILSTNKEDAARQALQIMRDKKSTATVMNVVEFDNTADEPEEFDLSEDKAEKIRFIKRVLNDFGNTSCTELESDHSPSLNSTSGNVCELIEQFNVDGVESIVYDDEIELEYNTYSYEDLDDDIIDEIVFIMEEYEAQSMKDEERRNG